MSEMDPPEDLHGLIFGSNTSSAKRTTSGQHTQDLPSAVRGGPQVPYQNPPWPLGSNAPPLPPYMPAAVAPGYHQHRVPSSSASSSFVPLVQNTVRTPPSNTGLNPSLQRLKSIDPASPLPKRDLPSPKTQQTDAKRRASNNNDESAVQKRPKTSKAAPVNARQIQQYDENDIRAKAPEDWDQVKLIQQVLESAIRAFARVTGRTPPSVSPWLSYRQQRDAFQQALDRYWEIDKRPGQPPELAGIGPCYGPLKSIIDAHVVITEDELEYATHPTVASYQPVPGSIAWLESIQNFEYLLQNQMQPSVDARSTGRRYHGIRPSAAQPMSLQVDHQAIRAEGAAPYGVGALVARKIEEAMPANDRQSMWPMQFDEVGEPPYLA